MTKNKTLLTSIATTISFVVAFVFALTIFFTVPNKKAHAEAEPFTERPDSIKYDTGSYNDAILSEVEGKKSDDYHGAFTVFIYSDEDCNNEVTGAMNEIGTFYAKVSWTADGDYSDGSCTFGFLVQPKDVTIDNTIFETDPTLLESSYGNYVPLLDNDSLDAKGLTMDALGLKANAGDDIDLSFEFYDHSTGEPLEGVGNGHTLNAGTYHIRPVLSGNDADKYMLTGQEWEYVINPKQVSFYLYYNNAEYNGSSIVYDGQIKNFTLVRDELDDTQVSATIDSWIFYNEVYRTKEEIHTTVYMEDVLLAGQYSDPQTTITPLDNSGLVASNYEVYISNTSTITVDKAELNGLLTISQSKWMFGEEISNFKQKMSMNFSGLTSDNKEEWFEIEYKLSSSSGDTGTFYSVVPLPNVLKPTVNTYVMGASIAESVNYNALTDDTLFPTCTLTISKAEVYAIPDELEITYTGESLKPEFTFELYHKDSGIHPESYYGIGSMAVAMDDTGGNRIDCGMYSSTLVIKSGTYEDGTYSDFFVLVDESDGSTREYVSISYNIVPKELILSVEFSDLTYGNSVLVPTWNYKDNDDSTGIYITGFVEKDLDANDLILSELQAQYSVHFEYATSYSAPDEDWSVFTPKDAGTYYVRMYVSGFENYKDGVIISTYPFKINPKVADFAWTNLVFDYDGEQHAPTATVTNLEEGDECTVTVSSTGCNAYSGYTTMAFSLSNENYTITNDSLNRTSPSYEIRKLNVYVLPHSSQSKIYGSDDPVLDFAYTGSILNQELVFEGALSREAGENVGTYNITLGTLALKGGVSVNANYT